MIIKNGTYQDNRPTTPLKKPIIIEPQYKIFKNVAKPRSLGRMQNKMKSEAVFDLMTK